MSYTLSKKLGLTSQRGGGVGLGATRTRQRKQVKWQKGPFSLPTPQRGACMDLDIECWLNSFVWRRAEINVEHLLRTIQ